MIETPAILAEAVVPGEDSSDHEPTSRAPTKSDDIADLHQRDTKNPKPIETDSFDSFLKARIDPLEVRIMNSTESSLQRYMLRLMPLLNSTTTDTGDNGCFSGGTSLFPC